MFLRERWKSFKNAVEHASNAEKVRAVLALTLVGVLIALPFAPSGDKALTTAAETLAISVVAFYFGLHTGTGTRRGLRTEAAAEQPVATLLWTALLLWAAAQLRAASQGGAAAEEQTGSDA